MDIRDNWEFSSEVEDRLNKFCLKLEAEKTSKISKDWMVLLHYNSLPQEKLCQMEVDGGTDRKEEILKTIKKYVESEAFLPESMFLGISINSLSRILRSVNSLLDEFGFCLFCKFIASWDNCTLVEHSLRSVVLEKLKEKREASGCVTLSVKELAISKPEELCQNVLISLLTDDTFQFSDVEFLSGVFSVLPIPQKELLIKKFIKKVDFLESDWKLLYPLVGDLSQDSLLSLLECIQKFSPKFTKSTVFGKFLVNFCKNFELFGNKDTLREVVQKHETLLKIEAMKYLEQVTVTMAWKRTNVELENCRVSFGVMHYITLKELALSSILFVEKNQIETKN